MFGSNAISVAIGIILVYFVLSTLVSGLSEVVEAFIGRRAVYLEAGIEELLGRTLKAHIYAHPRVQSLQSTKGSPRTARGVVAATMRILRKVSRSGTSTDSTARITAKK